MGFRCLPHAGRDRSGNGRGEETAKGQRVKILMKVQGMVSEEIKKQLEYDVLLNEQFYNGILNVRIGKPPKDFLK